MIDCPCGSRLPLDQCCEPYIKGTTLAPTPEALMRSRYTAFVLHNMEYLQKTMRGEPLKSFDPAETLQWLAHVTWVGLTVMKTKQKSSTVGYVSFDAQYRNQDQLHHICEKSEFHRIQNQWYYIGGKPLNPHRARE